jgi:serine/threonine protein kinase
MSFIDWIKSLWYRQRLYVPGRFETLETCQGNFAQVFKVRERSTDTIYALKLLDPSRVEDYQDRFADERLRLPSEGEITQAIHHTHVVRCLETGQTIEEEPYLLMEWLPGRLLSEMVAEAAESSQFVGRRLQLVRQLAGALQAVHDAGFLHRDVCPNNVMVDLEGNDVVLFDFSLAVPNDPKYIRPGLRFVRPDYMAPEMMMRSVDGVKLDMYAFGITAYELITGYFPYSRTTEQTTVARAFRAPVDIFEFVPGLDPIFATAVMKCLLYDPMERMPTARAFLDAVGGVDEADEEEDLSSGVQASAHKKRAPRDTPGK